MCTLRKLLTSLLLLPLLLLLLSLLHSPKVPSVHPHIVSDSWFLTQILCTQIDNQFQLFPHQSSPHQQFYISNYSSQVETLVAHNLQFTTQSFSKTSQYYITRTDPEMPEKSLGYTVKELDASQYAHTDPLTTPIEKCFNWGHEFKDLLQNYGKDHFYLVVFRSVRKKTADTEMLYFADAASQEEARLSGGLLKYWYGTLNTRRECLAMCIWESREDAIKAIHKPAHRVAMNLAAEMYDTYTLERYWLKIDCNFVPTFELVGSMTV